MISPSRQKPWFKRKNGQVLGEITQKIILNARPWEKKEPLVSSKNFFEKICMIFAVYQIALLCSMGVENEIYISFERELERSSFDFTRSRLLIFSFPLCRLVRDRLHEGRKENSVRESVSLKRTAC